MKKLLSVVLAVAMMTTMCISMVGFQASAEETTMLLPASNWAVQEGPAGKVATITDGDNGAVVLSAETGTWPAGKLTYSTAMVVPETGSFSYKFEVGGEFRVLLAVGATGAEDTTDGNYIELNKKMGEQNGKTPSAESGDLPAGTYEGTINFADLTVPAAAKADGKITITGIKIFAVGGKVTAYKAALSDATGGGSAAPTTATTAGGATTTKAATTTASNAKTGWEDNIALYAIVALGAAAVVTVSVVAGKKAKSK